MANEHTSQLNISLETFYARYRNFALPPQRKISHFDDIHVQAPNTTLKAALDLYTEMAGALKRVTPNLETVELFGAHLYKPSNEVRAKKNNCQNSPEIQLFSIVLRRFATRFFTFATICELSSARFARTT